MRRRIRTKNRRLIRRKTRNDLINLGAGVAISAIGVAAAVGIAEGFK